MGKLKTILAPFDGSSAASRSLTLAASLASGCDAEVIALYVYPATASEVLGFVALSNTELHDATTRAARRTLEAAKDVLASSECRHALASAFGDPAREIIIEAEKRHVDMIVMGSRGLSDFQELLLGSVSSKVVHHAPMPVTVVR